MIKARPDRKPYGLPSSTGVCKPVYTHTGTGDLRGPAVDSGNRTMDRGQYSIRAFTESDYPAVARINSAILPEFPETAEDARRWSDVVTKDPGRLMRKLIVEEAGSGSVVGWGQVAHTLFNFHPDKYNVRVAVDAAHRRKGIGQELYRLLETDAVERKAVSLWASAREDDPSSIRFLDRRGFVTTHDLVFAPEPYRPGPLEFPRRVQSDVRFGDPDIHPRC